MGLGDRIDHNPTEMSGGQRQRVAIARALINDPAIIMADEPTGNLDTKSSYEIMDIFKKMNDNGKTVVMVTHEPDIAEQTKRILTMRDGKLVSDEWRLTMFNESIKMAIDGMISNKLRTLLTLLGIIIGVALLLPWSVWALALRNRSKITFPVWAVTCLSLCPADVLPAAHAWQPVRVRV